MLPTNSNAIVIHLLTELSLFAITKFSKIIYYQQLQVANQMANQQQAQLQHLATDESIHSILMSQI